MRSRTRGFWTAAWLGVLAITVAAAVGTDVKPIAREAERAVSAGEASGVQVATETALMEMIHPLPAGAVITPVVLGEAQADGSMAAVSTLVYSNTLGSSVFAPSTAGSRFADDITTTASADCLLDKFAFKVNGNSDGSLVNPTPFTVEYALYASCPGATFTPVAIPETTGTFSPVDNGLGVYEVTVPIGALTNVPIPPRLYLGLKFSRTKVGVVVGAPAQIGFSDDRFDFPVFSRCAASFGQFPVVPHASIWAQIYARGTCPSQFAIYSNSQHAASAFSPGSLTYFADDIEIDSGQLEGLGCQLAGYEIAMKATSRTGSGGVEVDLRGFLDNNDPVNGGLIAGTRTQKFIFSDAVQKLNMTFDPPLSLASLPDPNKLFVVFTTSSAVVGPILTCRDADIGTTQDLYQVFAPGGSGWTVDDAGPSCHAAFDITLFCAGAPPPGACCDMVLRENKTCIAGANNGQPCQFPGDCPGGNCAGDSVCRDVPRINCPFPDRWRRGVVCASTCLGGVNNGQPCSRQLDCPGGECPGPWIDGKPCGQSQCCTFNDFCNNLTEKDCFGTEPIESSKVNAFNRGHFCDEFGNRCPFGACLGREGECSLARQPICRGGRHDGEVCDLELPFFLSPCFLDGYCDDGVTPCNAQSQNCLPGNGTCRGGTCTGVPGCKDAICCTAVCDIDFFCCDTHWDETCASTAAEICTGKPSNDECFGPGPTDGAVLLPIPFVSEYNAITSTRGSADPGFCCKDLDPGGLGDNTIWFRFVAPQAPTGSTKSSVQVTTCGTTTGGPNPADDSLLQGFSVGTPDAGLCANNRLATCSVSAQDCATGEGPCLPDLKTWCENLSPLGCNDNSETACSAGPTPTPKNSRLCMQNLTPGQTYYVMLGTKDASHKGQYRLTISSPCASLKPLKANDLCPNASVLDGSTLQIPFDLAGSATVQPATFDCPGPGCPLAMINDLWYQWVAPNNGELRVDTCAGDPSPETTLVVYEGCECPVQHARERKCSASVLSQDCRLGSDAVISVTRNQCYKFRLGGVSGGTPAGNLNVNFRGCPIGNVTFLDPPDGVIDARQPFAPDQSATRQGIQSVRVAGPLGTDNKACWALCETLSVGAANAVSSALPNPDGTFTIRFTRPITSKAVTSLTFTQGNGTEQRMVMTYHPGNADGDGFSNTTDILSLAGFLTGPTVAPWGAYSIDADRSGLGTPGDLLRMIDMRQAAAGYPSTGNIPLPLCGICCPAGP